MADPKQDAKITKYEPPKELETKAAVQKFIGRPKRQPVEQAEYFYNVKGTHIWMFVSSLLMLVSFIMMFDKDYRRPWKDYQKQFAEMEFEKLFYDMNRLEEDLKKDQDKLKAIDARIDSFLADYQSGKDFDTTHFKDELPVPPGLENPPNNKVHVTIDPEKAKKKLFAVEKEKIRGDHYLKQMDMNFAKDELGAVRFRFEEAKHHYEDAVKKGSPRVPFYESHYLHEKQEWEKVNKKVDKEKAAFDEVDKQNTFYGDFIDLLEKPLSELKKSRAVIVKELEEKEIRFARERPSFANKFRNAPIFDFSKPTLKIEQKILPDLKDQLNFTRIEKVDRCHTCHVGIGKPTYDVFPNPKAESEVDALLFKNDFLRDFVAHARGTVDQETCKVCAPKERKNEEIKAPLTPHKSWSSDDAIRFTKVFRSHPRLDLFVDDSSKHPISKVGCTVCHEGDGRDTDFTRAVHFPNTTKQGQDWRRRHGTPFGEERYNWNYRELWDLPMFPTKYVQASCRRCHTDAVELDGAPKYVEGMKILERAGCYGCHRVDTYQILKKDHDNPAIPDNRKNRRPGPPLTRIANKTTEDWAGKWVLAPREFRPTTRMPHFFKLSNTRHEVNQNPYPPRVDEKTGVLRSPVDDAIVASMVKYIWSLSETKPDPAPPDLKGDPRNGELLVRQVGCMACHKIEETAPEVYFDLPGKPKAARSRFLEEFAPTLMGVGSKMNKAWLYHWVKDPKRHFKDSAMPNLRLTEQEAADVVEYLMTLKKPEWEKVPPPQASAAVVKDLSFEILRKVIPDADAARVLEGKLIGKVEEAIYKEFKTPEGQVKWLGRKMVKNYGCYSCHLLKTEEDKDVALRWDEEEGIGVEFSGSQPFGSKHHDRLDFGFAADDGVNHHGVAFKHGFTGDEVKGHVHEARHYWLEAKLGNPRLFDGGKMAGVAKDGTVVKGKPWDELLRMPWFDFNEHEIERLATFVLSFTDHVVAGLIDNAIKRPNPKEWAEYRGDRVVRENNCRACHRMSLDKFWMEHTKTENGKSKKEKVWVEGRFGREEPDAEGSLKRLGLLGENEDLKKSGKRLFTYSWTTDHRTLTMPGAVKESKYVYFDGRDEWYLDVEGGKVKEKIEILRHIPQDGGDIIPEIRKFKRDLSDGKFQAKFGPEWTDSIDIDNESNFESRYPPMLRSQGVKTQADWLYRFLKQPYPIRPTLGPLFPGAKTFTDVNVRMPTFELTDEEANAVVRWFAVRDHLAGKDFFPHTEILERVEPMFSERKAAMDKVGPVIKEPNTGCASCHYIAGKAPPGEVIKHAPDLARVEERLRPRWLKEWQDTPANIYPGTTMTTYDFKALFGGNQRDGVEAAVQYLLNFGRLNAESKK